MGPCSLLRFNLVMNSSYDFILRVTLTELMIAAGYIDQPTTSQGQERELHLNKTGEDALGLELITSQY